MIRTIRAALLLAALLPLAATPAHAQVFGQLTSAEIIPINGHEFGGYFNVSDNVVGMLGQLRMSFYPGVDFGFQGGLSRLNVVAGDRTSLRLGTDVRVGAARASESFPVDLAIGGGLGVETSDRYHVLTLMPSAVASRPYALGQSASVSPYLGVGLSFRSIDVASTRENDFSIPLRLGADLKAMPGVRIAAELQVSVANSFGDNVGFAAGVNMPF
jgi:hypothetical protein